METNKILSADVLDILFEGRNKEYGAYALRKGYNGRLGRSLLAMAGLVVVLFMMSFVGRRGKVKKDLVIVDTVALSAIAKEIAPPPPPPPPPPKPQPPVATRIFTAPVLVQQDPPEDEKPPVVDDLTNVRIGATNTPGGIDDGNVAPPVGKGVGNVVEKPKEVEDDAPFTVVQIESTYPGGVSAWARFLNKSFRYPEAAQSDAIQGTVVVRFIVDKDGNVSDVEAISGPDQDGLREEAVRVIKKSGKWIPAVQNGRNVKSYKQQPVVFKIAE